MQYIPVFGDFSHLSNGVVGVHPTVDVEGLAVAEIRTALATTVCETPKTEHSSKHNTGHTVSRKIENTQVRTNDGLSHHVKYLRSHR